MSKRSRRPNRADRPSRADRPPRIPDAPEPHPETVEMMRSLSRLVGVDPSNSLVLILFEEGRVKRFRSRGAIRVDLPPGDDPELLQRWASGTLATALRAHKVIGVAPVVCTDATFAPSGRPPGVALLRAVSRQAERMGLRVVERFCIAADGWGSLDDPRLPRGGFPLDSIRTGYAPRRRTPASPPAAASAARRAFERHYVEWWGQPAGVGGSVHGVALRTPAEGEPHASSKMERYRWGEDTAELLELVERALDPHDDGAAEPCPCRALLLALGERQGIENLVLLQLGWGRELARRTWAAVNAPEAAEDAASQLVAAISGGRIRRPDAARLDRAIEVLVEVLGYATPSARATIDGTLAWLHWARGGASVAAQYAERSLRVGPVRDLPSLVLAKADAGQLPEWVYRRNPAKEDPFDLRALTA